MNNVDETTTYKKKRKRNIHFDVSSKALFMLFYVHFILPSVWSTNHWWTKWESNFINVIKCISKSHSWTMSILILGIYLITLDIQNYVFRIKDIFFFISLFLTFLCHFNTLFFFLYHFSSIFLRKISSNSVDALLIIELYFWDYFHVIQHKMCLVLYATFNTKSSWYYGIIYNVWIYPNWLEITFYTVVHILYK